MNSKFLKTIGCLAIALASAACSSEEMTDGNELPEGKYPITFTATGLQAMAVSRVTADGTWTEGDVVAVRLEGGSYNETRQYKVSTTGSTATLVCNDDKGPFYWQSTSDSYDVKASIHGGVYYTPYFPTGIDVTPYQNSESYYQQSDFLYAYGTLSYDERNNPLTFYHQTAKVVVHVIGGDDTPAGMTISSMKTRKLSLMTATWVAPTEDKHYGECTADYSFTTNFNTLAFTAGEITLPDKTKAKPLASYKFLIVPQTVKADGSALFIINSEGTSYNYIPTADIEWKAGQEYTYYIRIKGSEVTATVSTSIGWTEGSAGAGSVEIE